MTRSAVRVVRVGWLASAVLAGCERGPAEKAGEKLDQAVDDLMKK